MWRGSLGAIIFCIQNYFGRFKLVYRLTGFFSRFDNAPIDDASACFRARLRFRGQQDLFGSPTKSGDSDQSPGETKPLGAIIVYPELFRSL